MNGVSRCLYQLGFFSQRYKGNNLRNTNVDLHAHDPIFSIVSQVTHLSWQLVRGGVDRGKIESLKKECRER